MKGFLSMVAVATVVVAGCITPPPEADEADLRNSPSARLARAETLYQREAYTEAMQICLILARQDQMMPGLADLQSRIAARIARQRSGDLRAHSANTVPKAQNDIEESRSIPDTFRLRRVVRGESGAIRKAATRMAQVLQRKVSVHLEGADLQAFVLAMGEADNVNIIADNDLGGGGAINIHADDVPLREILDYVARNLDVSFHVGESLIWATSRSAEESESPLETRIYRLRKGDPGLTVDVDAGAGAAFDESHALLQDAINRFVPQVAGADFLYNRNAHVVIVKNTPANHALVEDILESLDVTPPQVLIEARFITVRVSNLRELGIDWILNSPVTVTREAVLENGVAATKPQTQIDQGATIGFPPFPNEAIGANLAYTGILTDPMFQAVLHALENSGKARVLSVPRVTTVNNHQAVIHVGENFLYFDTFRTIETTDTITTDGVITTMTNQRLVPEGSPIEVPLGISLGVVPSVGADLKSITLSLNPHIEAFVRYEEWVTSTDSAGTDTNRLDLLRLPIFKETDINTKVVVRSGETVVMGGIIQSSDQKTVNAVPLLSSIPLLGNLFKHDTVERVEENLLIFVTATIISEIGEDLVPLEETAATASGAP
jgi:type IV pilus assembly protein PilQ